MHAEQPPRPPCRVVWAGFEALIFAAFMSTVVVNLPRAGGNPGRTPRVWIPACAGKTSPDPRLRGDDERADQVRGNLRCLIPVKANSAFASAGATGGTPGSPMPVGKFSLAIRWVSISGVCASVNSG